MSEKVIHFLDEIFVINASKEVLDVGEHFGVFIRRLLALRHLVIVLLQSEDMFEK